MSDKFRERIIHSLLYGRSFLLSILIGVLCGLVCGLVGCAFLAVTDLAYARSGLWPWTVFFLPLAGLLIVFLYHRAGVYEDRGTNLVLESVRTSQRVPLRTGILIFVSTALTHLCGGSSGREGACLQIGASVGQTIGKLFHFDEQNLHLITMCGMSGLFTALLGTPITAAVFSMEVISVGVLYHSAFIPCLVTAMIVFALRNMFGFPAETAVIARIPEVTLLSLGRILLLGVACSLVAILFCYLLHHTGQFLKKWIPNAYLRAAAGGLLVAALTLLAGTRDYNGPGLAIAFRAVEGEARPEAFLLKMLFTAVTLGSGFKRGEIVPSFFVGATFGSLAGSFLGLPAGFSASLGMIGLFCGVVNCPVSSLLLSVELFGSQGMIFYALMCGTCYVLSGYYGLYSSQTILYSKTRPSFINRKTL